MKAATATKTRRPKAPRTTNRLKSLTDGDGQKPTLERAVIAEPNFEVIKIKIIGGPGPMVQNRFSQRALRGMRDTQIQGSKARSKKIRKPRDFDADYEAAKHTSTAGWIGIPCSAIRAGMISACRAAGFKMTHAKLGFWCVPDGIDADDGLPLLKITKGKPHKVEHTVRNQTGVADIRARPMFDAGWEAIVTIKFDADMFEAADIMRLLWRMGEQVGLAEGRNDSKSSAGQGWGGFDVQQKFEQV